MPVKSNVAAPSPQSPSAVSPVVTKPNLRYLELALYKNYTRMGQKFEKGKVYGFTSEQAVILLGEQDAGRAVWKVFRKPLPVPTVEQKIQSNIVDASKVEIIPTFVDDTMPTMEAIEIGNDEEIADIIEESDEDTTPV